MFYMIHPPIVVILFAALLCIAGIWGLLLIDAIRKKDRGKKRLFTILMIVTLLPVLAFYVYLKYSFHYM
jgi:hypothetical protein